MYIRSSRVYGFSNNDNTIFDEESINCYNNLNLDFIYDGSKKLAESLLFNYSNKVNYNIAILRLFKCLWKLNSLDDSTLIKKIMVIKEQRNSLFVKTKRILNKGLYPY